MPKLKKPSICKYPTGSKKVASICRQQDGIFVWTGADIPDSIAEMITAARNERMIELE